MRDHTNTINKWSTRVLGQAGFATAVFAMAARADRGVTSGGCGENCQCSCG